MAKDYANLGFGTGWAQAADQVCTLADGFVTVRGERSNSGRDAAPDFSLSSAAKNLSSDLYFRASGQRHRGEAAEGPAPAGPSRDAKESMRGFAAGYNAWLRKNRDRITDPGPGRLLGAAGHHPGRGGTGFALAVLGGQGRGIDGITAAQPPTAAPPAAGVTPKEAAAAAQRLLSTQNADMGSNVLAFRVPRRRTGAGCSWATRTTRGTAAAGSGSRSTIPGELNVAGGSLLGSTHRVLIGHNADVAVAHTVATGVTLNLHQLTLDPAYLRADLVDGSLSE
ncbi:Penicillin amidase OS=Streptomyces microflavus OX=1919 GN=Smic_82240 PE=3 SV=1 [Streptomyces microflavus]